MLEPEGTPAQYDMPLVGELNFLHEH